MTEQSYAPVRDDTTLIEQTAQAAPTVTIEETLDSLLNWTAQSMLYVKRRNFLTKREKLQILCTLEDYQYFLIGEKDHPALRRDRPHRDRWEHLEIESRLSQQARINAHAVFYEIPPYPLPETVQPAPGLFARFCVESDSMSPYLLDGDTVEAIPVDVADYLNTTGLVCVGIRFNWRTPRKWRIARLVSIDEQEIRLSYDNPEYKEKAEVVVSRSGNVLLYKVFRIERNIK